MRPDGTRRPTALAAPVAPPDPLDDRFVALLQGEAQALPAPNARLRRRLMRRVLRAAEAGRAFDTLRADSMTALAVAPGVTLRWLHRHDGAGLRPGEPLTARLLDMRPGSRCSLPALAAGCREWLVVRGDACVDGRALARCSYVASGVAGADVVAGPTGAGLYLRETAIDTREPRFLPQHEDAASWSEFAPGIRRRLLYRRDNEAAMLYHVLPGAEVPRHAHDHDEECLLIDGELFLDDILLRRGDYQLAPAGTLHGSVSTDTGALLYAHGDLDLHLLPA